MKAEIVYASSYSPNMRSASSVLAFLLVPEDTWVSPHQPCNERFDANELLRESKRLVLLTWYTNHIRSGL